MSAVATGGAAVPRIEPALRARLDAGGRCLVPYFSGGLGDWTTTLQAIAGAGADAMEVGIPFSDPVMDGPVIQEANDRALAAGITPERIFDGLTHLDAGVPLAVMTYANLVFRFGWDRFAGAMVDAGVSAAIVPDIPLEELPQWTEPASAHGVETVLLAAPTADDRRLAAIVERASGFVYAVGLLGVTGERESLASTAKVIASRLKSLTDKPVLVGVGVGTPAQAVEACEVADGVVVGSAIVRRALETSSPEAVADLVGEFRTALDRG